MLESIKIFTSDATWRNILEQMHASVVDDALIADVNLDDMHIDTPVTPMQYQNLIMPR